VTFSSVEVQQGSDEITFFHPHPNLSDSVEIFTGFMILVTFSSVEVQPGSDEITFFHPHPNLSDSVEILPVS